MQNNDNNHGIVQYCVTVYLYGHLQQAQRSHRVKLWSWKMFVPIFAKPSPVIEAQPLNFLQRTINWQYSKSVHSQHLPSVIHSSLTAQHVDTFLHVFPEILIQLEKTKRIYRIINCYNQQQVNNECNVFTRGRPAVAFVAAFTIVGSRALIRCGLKHVPTFGNFPFLMKNKILACKRSGKVVFAGTEQFAWFVQRWHSSMLVHVCAGISCAALVCWWRVINFLLCSHNFHWGFQERCQQANVQPSSQSLDEVRVCKERWVLVQWRVLSPLATALWTGQIAKLCVSVCLFACARVFFFVVGSAVLSRTYTPLRVTRAPVCVPCTHFLSNCEQAELKCVCVCVFDVWFLKQRAALELLRASERNIWCWNMVSHLIDNKYQEMCGEEESGHTVVKVRVSQGEQVKDSSADSRGWGSEWEMGCQLEVTLRSWKSAGQQGEGHKQAFSCLSATLTLRYVLFYILQFHFFFLWLKIGRLLQFSLQISGSTEAEEIPLSSAHHATSIQLAHIFFTSVTFMPSHWILFTVHFTLKSSSLNQV